ncbi:hypothetical protein [Aliidiomarina maris]|uniref:DUF3784 domain-containing protein n=2 Tax=Aliidiomarina maris TaxID=531312 RepID=A0ABY0BTI3_9GAMM|nr:hypothetical protein [Aliidiomarina maris]MCL4410500.1 hypothetical protein [Gammaproteobacteria bacterium]RUO27543.1 hypothetical protein CWE07_02625 [Aliidiomarina maris]
MVLFGLFMTLMFGVLPCLGFGYLIAYKQARTLITRWDDDKFHDPVAAATIVGKSIMAMGVLIFVFVLVLITGILPEWFAVGLLILLSCLPLIALWHVRKVYGV